jgi:hypothetical protein
VAIIKGLSSRATPQKIVDYLTKEEKTEEKLISGKDCNPETIVQEFRATKELYDKKDGVQYHHMIQSFSPKDNITPQKAHELGNELAEKQFKGHEVFVVTHKDKEHLHNHLVVNSVSFEDGKKYQSNRTSMIELKRESNRQCEREGLTTLDLEHRATERVTTGEKRIEMKGGTPWKDELRQCIDFSKERANNFEEFKNSLKKNFDIDTRITNKTISYQHPEKAKPIRGSKLGTNYDKEVLENEFTRKEKSITGRGTTQNNRGEGDRPKERLEGNTGDSQDIGIKVLFGDITRRNEISSSRNDKPIGANKEIIEPVPTGQTGAKPKASSEREGETGYKGENKPNIQGLQKGNRGNENSQLSESRGNDQEIGRGANGESRLSQQDDKEHTGISASSKEHSEPIMEGKSETILNTTTSNIRNDSLSNRSISTGDPLDEIVKALGSSIEKVLNEEKAMAAQEKIKLEKQMARPQKTKQKEEEQER